MSTDMAENNMLRYDSKAILDDIFASREWCEEMEKSGLIPVFIGCDLEKRYCGSWSGFDAGGRREQGSKTESQIYIALGLASEGEGLALEVPERIPAQRPVLRVPEVVAVGY